MRLAFTQSTLPPCSQGQKPPANRAQSSCLPACLQIFVVFLMHVHNAMPLSNQREAVSQEPPRNPHRSTMSSPVPADDTIVMDAPLAQWLRFHWPKYVLWAALEGLLLVIAMRFQVAGGSSSQMLLWGLKLIGHVATCRGL